MLMWLFLVITKYSDRCAVWFGNYLSQARVTCPGCRYTLIRNGPLASQSQPQYRHRPRHMSTTAMPRQVQSNRGANFVPNAMPVQLRPSRHPSIRESESPLCKSCRAAQEETVRNRQWKWAKQLFVYLASDAECSS
eukprot:scpid19394/ scgid18230/ 